MTSQTGKGAPHHLRDAEGPHGRHGGGHRHHGRGRHGGRMFDYGELRLLVLAMIADAPRHGYELIKAIEERMGGSYSPSPGVMYPTLSWLEDMGYASVQADGAGRKRYSATPDGAAYLQAHRAAVDDLLNRASSSQSGKYDGVPTPIIRGMENVKLALRLRLRNGSIDQDAVDAIASALDAAARTIERS